MPIVEMRNLRKTFAKTIAVDDVNLSIEEGEIFGILGPNGAGKSTTVECMTGMQKADGGHLRVLGLDPASHVTELRRHVGYQLQATELPDAMRVGEALDLFASFYPDPLRADELLDTVGLTRLRKSAFGKLSGGEKQRLSIALALIGDPRIAVLDELTTGLDPQGRRDIWRLIDGIRQRGVTVVLVTHFLDEAQTLCDQLSIIDHGRSIATGTPKTLIDQARISRGRLPATLEDAYLAIIDDNADSQEWKAAS
ncbi:MAG: ABC transporter ATP-binding protein [Propionibacteriaceae bacterium]